jgi:ABC-type nitrate/sulfonate/bicarbonate transport system substrate-binding protein
MIHPWRYFSGALLSALVIFLLAIGAGAAELRKFRLGYSTVGPAGTGLWMAKEIGAFEKYGIDADLIFISSGPVVVQALIGGDLQGGFAATNAVIAAVLGGALLVAVGQKADRRRNHRRQLHHRPAGTRRFCRHALQAALGVMS